ncbi:hypothetical protein [Oceanispirochaeta crateris]|uniref:hypothetical protein n=1 Tax=Oceanispirochaeta crateris TaxID=2518645 RepID=UPI00143DFFD4|nr:hypothetical protein [Oceanispirochaeta crateris]
MDTIDMLKERTKELIPIFSTSKQLQKDKATLILDTTEFITDMYTDSENVHALSETITKMIIEFSYQEEGTPENYISIKNCMEDWFGQ